ncbi:MAG TPA: GFA family protein [Alphaproteobacteria bacterium]|nr:GFA family protein [Alphaproteobacteria bacterium]
MKRGRCLCGEVRFEYEGPENWRGHCHCDSCRRNTSSPFTTFFGVPRAAFRFTGTPPRVYHSSPGVRRLFCAHCGTPMAYENDRDKEEIHLYAACLEDSKKFSPQFHVYWAEKVPWIELSDHLPKYDRTRRSDTSKESPVT